MWLQDTQREERGSYSKDSMRGKEYSDDRYQIQNKISTETTRDECDAVFQNIKANKMTMDDTT